MPSRFFDYESDLQNPSQKSEDKHKTGFRRSTKHEKPRQDSTSEPTSTTTTRSSFSSTGTSAMSHSSWHPSHHAHHSAGATSSGSHNMRDPHREEQIEPTAQVQEWAHQMHIQQQKRYWWCSSCYPKAPTLHIPSDKAMKRVRIVEPTHAYE